MEKMGNQRREIRAVKKKSPEIRAMKKHLDISDLIKQKEEHRRKMAALPFEEKVRIAFSLSARHQDIKKARSTTPAKTSRPTKLVE
jgi:hypothetical protein